jgi:hypothetical protein
MHVGSESRALDAPNAALIEGEKFANTVPTSWLTLAGE